MKASTKRKFGIVAFICAILVLPLSSVNFFYFGNVSLLDYIVAVVSCAYTLWFGWQWLHTKDPQ
jgi:hypothetical protein